MPVTITRVKSKVAKVKATTQDKLMQLIALVEDFAKVKASLRKLAPLQKQEKELRARFIDALPASLKAGEGYAFIGDKHVVEVSPAARERRITDMKAVHELLGDDVFYQLATISLADFDKYLTPDEQQGVVDESLTGARRITVVKKE